MNDDERELEGGEKARNVHKSLKALEQAIYINQECVPNRHTDTGQRPHPDVHGPVH